MKDRFYILLAVFFILLAIWVQVYGRVIQYQKTGESLFSATKDTEKIEPIKILFVGDIMLDRTVRTTIEKNGFDYPFEDIKSIFDDQDLVIGNLEGAITSNQSLSQKNFDILRFTFPPDTAKNLKSIGFSGFNLANNHSLDFGQEGYLETAANLGIENLLYFGSPSNDKNLSTSINKNGKNICFVGYQSLYVENTKNTINEIQNIKAKCDFIIVFTHWGNEYEDTENEAQRREGREFIDAGADLIVGTHPHIIQPVEIYKNKAIFYSLGNFIFDQDFSKATRLGLAVQVLFEEDRVGYKLIPIEMNKNKLFFSSPDFFKSRLDILTSNLSESRKVEVNSAMGFVLPR